MARRVVVTGAGLVTCTGIGTEETWQSLKQGIGGIRSIELFDTTGFDCRIAGEVRGFDPAAYIEKKEIKKMGRFMQFGIAASDFALAMANF